jgi:hypothetical protein
MEEAKKANAIIRDGFALLTEEADIKRFEPIKEIYNTASGMLQGDNKEYMEAILKGWMVSQANNMVFLLWRRGILTPEIEAAYRELPSTEEAVKDYDKFEDELKAVADDLEAQRKDFAEKQHGIDIFKAVLNGMSKAEAEAQYEKYKAQIAKAMRG